MRQRSNGRASRLVTAGFVGGIVAGLVVWSMQMRRSRRDLFSHNPVKRFAALGYLGGRPDAETARILDEYVRWETRPMLRARGERLLKRVRGLLV